MKNLLTFLIASTITLTMAGCGGKDTLNEDEISGNLSVVDIINSTSSVRMTIQEEEELMRRLNAGKRSPALKDETLTVDETMTRMVNELLNHETVKTNTTDQPHEKAMK